MPRNAAERRNEEHRVAILGTGLVGGSFAMALRRAFLEIRVVGWDRADVLARAQERGAIDDGSPDLGAACREPDLAYVALPVEETTHLLPEIAAAEMGNYLVHAPDGERYIRAMIRDDIAAAAGPFAGAASMLEDLAGVHLTVKRTERAAEASGAAQAAAVQEQASLISGRKVVPLPPRPLPDMLYGVIDGTGVPMTARETAGRNGKAEDGRARTREVKLAVFFTQDTLDDGGYPVRDPSSSSYIATFEPASVFAGLVEAEGIRRGANHVRQLTILGDGAPWIWNIATSKFPGATQIVDLFHAREHLHDLARRLEFMLGDRKDEWLAARLEDLDYGDIDGICRAARVFPLVGTKKAELDTALGYFEHNAPRMRYKWFRSRGLFVGSGVVESGCKAVIGQRLKLSGMRWSVTGADAIATLRCQQASRPEDRIWPARNNQTVTV